MDIAQPSLAAARDQAHRFAVALDAQPVTVIFDLVEPFGPRRHDLPVAGRQSSNLGMKHKWELADKIASRRKPRLWAAAAAAEACLSVEECPPGAFYYTRAFGLRYRFQCARPLPTRMVA